ncbi:MAG: ATP-binding protein [Bacteroidota bacterium]|nr:ATP-binding protein [Bacteroidota bacterium]
MLIQFSVSNWRSFKEESSISFIPSRERQHKARIPFLDEYGIHVLPTCALYGANASGKTNLFKALQFAKFLLVEGTKPDQLIPRSPFRLDKKYRRQPSRFKFVLYAEGRAYEYSFAVNDKIVLEEKLSLMLKTTTRPMFERKKQDIEFFHELEEQPKFEYLKEGTRSNQLFVTNAVSQQVDEFRPIYLWFRDVLTLIKPESKYVNFEQYFEEENPLCESMNSLLSLLDTGIMKLGKRELPLKQLPLPSEILEQITQDLGENRHTRIEINKDRFLIKREKNEYRAFKLIAYHEDADGKSIQFDLIDESDGTKRLIDLLPAFHRQSNTDLMRVFFIDEIDRSMHTQLTAELLRAYLGAGNKDSRSQIIFTTHDVMIMNQELLRRDEMWIADRSVHGESTIYSISDFENVRFDKDIRKSYLKGRFGGLPKILLDEFATIPNEDQHWLG